MTSAQQIFRGDFVKWYDMPTHFEVVGFGDPELSHPFALVTMKDNPDIVSISGDSKHLVHMRRKDGVVVHAYYKYLHKLSPLEALAEQA